MNLVTPVSLIRPAVVSHHKDVVPSQNTLPVDVSASKNASKNEATTSSVANPSEQSSLRLRIKVGSDNPIRKNNEIYSGLGLLSPSSSTGNDSEDSGGSPIESPGCVLRVSLIILFSVILLMSKKPYTLSVNTHNDNQILLNLKSGSKRAYLVNIYYVDLGATRPFLLNVNISVQIKSCLKFPYSSFFCYRLGYDFHICS